MQVVVICIALLLRWVLLISKLHNCPNLDTWRKIPYQLFLTLLKCNSRGTQPFCSKGSFVATVVLSQPMCPKLVCLGWINLRLKLRPGVGAQRSDVSIYCWGPYAPADVWKVKSLSSWRKCIVYTSIVLLCSECDYCCLKSGGARWHMHSKL